METNGNGSGKFPDLLTAASVYESERTREIVELASIVARTAIEKLEADVNKLSGELARQNANVRMLSRRLCAAERELSGHKAPGKPAAGFTISEGFR